MVLAYYETRTLYREADGTPGGVDVPLVFQTKNGSVTIPEMTLIFGDPRIDAPAALTDDDSTIPEAMFRHNRKR